MHLGMPIRSAVWVCGFLAAAALPCRADVLFVKADAAGRNDGTSWPDAFADLQAALDRAIPGDEIWVAAGTYTPSVGAYTPSARTGPNDPRSVTFQLRNGVALYGGFAGNEITREQREPATHPSILSGDLNGDDEGGMATLLECRRLRPVPGPPGCECFRISPESLAPECEQFDFDRNGHVTAREGAEYIALRHHGENAYHVVTGSETDPSAVLDGFVVTAGNADLILETNPLDGMGGGGMLNIDGSPTVVRCAFVRNIAFDGGGGMFNQRSSPVVTDCTFRQNIGASGGGMCNVNDSQPTLTRCVFYGNEGPGSNAGGGMYNVFGGSPTLINCLFVHNRAHAGAAIMNNFGGSPILINCTLSANIATQNAGGLMNWFGSNPTLVDCILWANRERVTTSAPAQIRTTASNAKVSYSCVEGGWPGVGNVDADPRFIRTPDLEPIGFDFDVTDDRPLGDLRLQSDSPCLDAGDNTAVPPDVSVDLDGSPRLADRDDVLDTGTGSAPIVDMGAYERQPAVGLVQGDGHGLLSVGANGFEPGDVDGDGDVDLADFLYLLDCFGRAEAEAGLGCQGFDLDADGDVDLDDIVRFQAAFTGAR